MIHKATVDTGVGLMHFEIDDQDSKRFVVALDATLDDFKGVPVVENGVPCVKYPDRTMKDCTKIDNCFYLHLGRVPDSVLVSKIEIFLKALKEKGIWTHEVPGIELPKIVK